jgi:hypothetical protein
MSQISHYKRVMAKFLFLNELGPGDLPGVTLC